MYISASLWGSLIEMIPQLYARNQGPFVTLLSIEPDDMSKNDDGIKKLHQIVVIATTLTMALASDTTLVS